MSQTIQNVIVHADLDAIKSETAKSNARVIISFFAEYLKDRDVFYKLWVKDEPIVFLPFTTEGVAVCKQSSLIGWEAIRTFWDPIFDMKGTFDWEIDEIIPSENPDIIITKSRSKVEAQTKEKFNNVKLEYQGTYVQIFRFEKGKVKSFEEFYDTAFLNEQYK